MQLVEALHYKPKVSGSIPGWVINLLNPELNPTCYLLALFGAHHFLHVSKIRVTSLTLRLINSYVYIYSYVCIYVYVYIYTHMCVYIYIYDISSLRINQILYCVSLKIYNKFVNYFCELKFSGNTHQRP